ncbi:MAG: cation transporter, partial [Pleurocapsa sp. SU_196_0]|nr:cation transporter [Pleurocapsa sp. SU_196_0]
MAGHHQGHQRPASTARRELVAGARLPGQGRPARGKIPAERQFIFSNNVSITEHPEVIETPPFDAATVAINAVLLFVVAGYVLYEGVLRFFDPEPVGSVGMLVVASIGLLVNLIAMRVLAGGKDASLNVKGAYLEVWADMLGSLGVIGAAILIYFTNWSWIDPLVAIGIGLWVL